MGNHATYNQGHACHNNHDSEPVPGRRTTRMPAITTMTQSPCLAAAVLPQATPPKAPKALLWRTHGAERAVLHRAVDLPTAAIPTENPTAGAPKHVFGRTQTRVWVPRLRAVDLPDPMSHLLPNQTDDAHPVERACAPSLWSRSGLASLWMIPTAAVSQHGVLRLRNQRDGATPV